jgi:hypothetical protein
MFLDVCDGIGLDKATKRVAESFEAFCWPVKVLDIDFTAEVFTGRYG